MFIPVKTPWVFKMLFPHYVWQIKTSEKVIYLTFDDGPTPNITDFVLNCLKTHQAKATFFCIGNNVEKHPDIFNRILADGHSVGNHTQNHLRGWESDTNVYVKNVIEAEAIIQASKWKTPDFDATADQLITSVLPEIDPEKSIIAKSSPKSKVIHRTSSISSLFRPPYGQIKPSQGKQLLKKGYKIIMWDVISFDWEQELSEDMCLQRVISNTESGSIVVFHDSIKASKNMMYALPKVLEYFSAKGFRFESLS